MGGSEWRLAAWMAALITGEKKVGPASLTVLSDALKQKDTTFIAQQVQFIRNLLINCDLMRTDHQYTVIYSGFDKHESEIGQYIPVSLKHPLNANAFWVKVIFI